MDNDALVVQYFASGIAGEAEKTDRGTYLVRGVPVFKAGTFRDSKGVQRTWNEDGLDQIAANFNTLRDNGVFKDVPIRSDHTRAVESIVGYFAGMERDGGTLMADLEFTEPEAYDKWKRGTYRARSLEVAPFQSNDETLYWPVAKGLAFVDIPAVEGLHSKSDVEEGRPPDPPEPKEPVVADVKTEQHFSIKGVPTTDVTAVQEYIAELEQKAGKAPEPQVFRLAGADVTDPAKIQEFINAQEKALDDLDKNGRKEFIEQCAKDDKIPAPQVDGLVAFAQALDGDQWQSYRKTLEDAPKVPAFAVNTNGNTKDQTTHTDDTNKSEDFTKEDELEQVISTFRKANVPEDKIKEMDSYKQLAALKAAK